MSQAQFTLETLPKETRVCLKKGCDARGRKRGFCPRHYSEWYRFTYPERIAASEARRREQTREYQRDYYLANRERIQRASADRYRRYREEDPDRLREWQKRSWAKNRYGLTLEEYETIMARGCAICDTRERICLDHDHATGKVRDALCHYCNMGLGSMKDDPARLRAAAGYLEKHRKGGDAL